MAAGSVSVGVAGVGAFGSGFAELFASHPLVNRIALCDREPDRVAAVAARPALRAKHAARDRFASLEELLRSDVDAVAIFTQPWLHAPQAVAALAAGKAVYSAVPVISLADGGEILAWCDKLIAASRRAGRHYMLGETTCYRPQAMFGRRQAAAGAFGRFVHADGHYLHDADSPAYSLRAVQRSRLTGAAGLEQLARMEADRARGLKWGPMHYPTHSVSGPLWVMRAYAVKVSAWGTRPPPGDDYFADYAFSNETALFRLSNDATLRVSECREIGHPGEEMFSVLGTAGSLLGSEGAPGNHWTDKAGSRRLADVDMRDALPDAVTHALAGIPNAFGGHGGSHPYLVHEFVSSVAERRRPAISAWEAVRFMAPGVMAHKSALQDGALLDVPDWGDPPA